jgi:hypothetical protein
MRIILAAAAFGFLAVPALPGSAAEAQFWRGNDDYREYRRDVRRVERDCHRDLRRADNRREYRRELRDCRRDLREARREFRHDQRDNRWGYGRHHAGRYYWDGRRWRDRW